MSDLKDSWKDTGSQFKESGKDVGHAFKTLVTGSPKETGSAFKETGKDVGHAFKGFGKSVFKSVKAGVAKADDLVNKNENEAASDEAKAADAKDVTELAEIPDNTSSEQ